MTEKGNDELLAEVADAEKVMAGVEAEEDRNAAEEERVSAEAPTDEDD